MQNEISISGLYYRYNSTSREKIQEYLSKIRIVKLGNKGVGTVHGYYPLTDDALSKVMEMPRNVSLTFDACSTSDIPIEGLKELKKIKYLVKSTSRFFLKPDVGEILDQIERKDLWEEDIQAICFNGDNYEVLPDTDGEHFLMTATLLI